MTVIKGKAGGKIVPNETFESIPVYTDGDSLKGSVRGAGYARLLIFH